MKRLLPLLLGLCMVLSACAHVPQEKLLANRHDDLTLTELLALDICQISDTIDPQEAYLLADTAITKTRELAQSYDMTSPPEYHNVLINMGLRERGLCWHWTTDLLTTFGALKLKTIDFMWAVAHQGSDLSEHNVTVIVARANPVFEDGLIFDPWRTAGKPYWIFMREDTKYPWVNLPPELW